MSGVAFQHIRQFLQFPHGCRMLGGGHHQTAHRAGVHHRQPIGSPWIACRRPLPEQTGHQDLPPVALSQFCQLPRLSAFIAFSSIFQPFAARASSQSGSITPRVDSPAMALANLTLAEKETLPVLVRFKNRLATIAACHQMANRAGIWITQCSWHGSSRTEGERIVMTLLWECVT